MLRQLKGRFTLIGGRIVLSPLDASMGPHLYAAVKAYYWIRLINTGKRPTRWNKPTSKGTRVTFEYLKNDEDILKALDELDAYVSHVNETLPIDLSLDRHV
ncbi:hypothetical protein [Paenibacillus amylolyticus]|uniref:hypothetical protein n=1 Tax=Paenibacillus amylolyticus TaxID=1451 RepID=UPI003394BD26